MQNVSTLLIGGGGGHTKFDHVLGRARLQNVLD